MKRKKKELLTIFREMIRKKTVSFEDMSQADAAEFAAFRALIAERFPYLAEAAEYRELGYNGMLFRVKGRSDRKPSVLMAHYDVVPADQEGWTHDPFGAELSGGRVYGRGTLDTKGTLFSIAAAVDQALSEGWIPKNDLYLSFGGEEETHGGTCGAIAEYLKNENIRPAFVLDEGGAVIPEGLPGLKKKAAMVGIAEKGTANYMLSVRAAGGHAATPPRHTAIGQLARAAVRIEKHPFPARLSEPVKKMFRELAPELPVYERFAFSHIGLFEPGVKLLAPRLGPTFNAMVRSTAALVIFEGRSAFNVLPDKAAMGVNVRILPGETKEGALNYLKKVVADPAVTVDLIDGTDPTPISDTACGEWQLLRRVVKRTWPDAAFGPYMLNGGTDSRFYSEISDHIYKFTPMEMTAAERKTVHGADESISVENLFTCVRFYGRLIREL
ncbi:MAG: M20/M25/M40 family metallo-hydrolase [Lachnospiraceae bacterium]|nr:M20/M25/M40 family metallo-hydrolase [Lachnospiraceae bacterium]